MEILHRGDLEQGGFADLREYYLVEDPRALGDDIEETSWRGIGNFAYLADSKYSPKGTTRMHSHKEIDVITFVLEGRLLHEGSLENGQDLSESQIQVQRAGGEGFSHNEINPDDIENRVLQLWVLPEIEGEPAGYKLYQPDWGKVTRIYGGAKDQSETFDSHTLVDVAKMKESQSFKVKGEFIAYLSLGEGIANDLEISEGDLIRGNGLHFKAKQKSQLVLVQLNE
ncbi:MAG: pilus assembly protein [Candidatus Nitrohelix vancouverensis]|uniref:Pilus assembly protein n=1 Tax=Candidatus Nitrohelix vancouverensis TaxID=2705534 RepID=A0A7T0C3H3_9BACT|nr:MAG: pilus assembly protein [Candidatus Nitrohelix vancouverensis]